MVSTVTCTISGTSRPARAIARRRRDDRGLALEQVLHGLDEQHVDAALEQAVHLQDVGVAEVGEARCAPSDGSLVPGPTEPTTKRGRPSAE